jgi:uncharacterized protein (DUF2062 family)
MKTVKPVNIFKYIMSGKARRIFKEHVLGSNDSNIRLSLSVAIGVLTSILPIWGFQTILAAFLAISLRLNKLILLTASHISVPPFTPGIIFASYVVGIIFYNESTAGKLHFSSQLDYSLTKEDLNQYVAGSILLAVSSALIIGGIVYILLLFFRKKSGRNHKRNNYVRL